MKASKRENLGRYIMGIGIGIMIGVSQVVGPGRKFWWWPAAITTVGLIVAAIGFEMVAPKDSE